MHTILWSELGVPAEPGDVRVEGLGVVGVTQENIANSASVGGDPEFELVESTSMSDQMRHYLLGLMR